MEVKFRFYWDWFFLAGCIFFLTIPWVWFGSLPESISLVRLGLDFPQSILSNPGPLSKEEWRRWFKGTPKSAFVSPPICLWTLLYFPAYPLPPRTLWWFRLSSGVERWEEIPFLSRILAVCDAFDSMVSSRPYYRSHFTRDEAKAEIKCQTGTQFDPRVVEGFLEMIGHSESGA